MGFWVSCGDNKNYANIILHSIEIKNDSSSEFSEAEILIGDIRTVASQFWPNQESNESYNNPIINIAEKSPIILKVKFKCKDKILKDQVDITAKLKPFEGKSVFIKFGINPEGTPIINNIVIMESKY